MLRAITLLPIPRLGLGNTWVRQLRSDSCHYPFTVEETVDVLDYDASEDEDTIKNMEANSETCEKTFPNSGPNESLDLGLETAEDSRNVKALTSRRIVRK